MGSVLMNTFSESSLGVGRKWLSIRHQAVRQHEIKMEQTDVQAHPPETGMGRSSVPAASTSDPPPGPHLFSLGGAATSAGRPQLPWVTGVLPLWQKLRLLCRPDRPDPGHSGPGQ